MHMFSIPADLIRRAVDVRLMRERLNSLLSQHFGFFFHYFFIFSPTSLLTFSPAFLFTPLLPLSASLSVLWSLPSYASENKSIGTISAPRWFIVSDIDDTLKVSHVKNSGWDKIQRAAHSTPAFPGMSDLYQAFTKTWESPIFAYVSTSARLLMGSSHRQFLQINDFPFGLIYSITLDYKDYKVHQISQLMDIYQPNNVLLIGDNGQHDIASYRNLRNKYSDRSFYIFIHHLYDVYVPFEENQIPFLTAVEIAEFLYQQKLITSAFLEVTLNFFDMENDDLSVLLFPNWGNCTNFPFDHFERMEEDLLNASPTIERATLSLKIKNYRRWTREKCLNVR